MKIKLLTLVIFCIAIANSGLGQSITRELISSTGDYFSNNDYSISWSLGEPLTETYSSGDYTLSQGFHQGDYLVIPPSKIKEEFKGIKIQVFPNPVSDYMIIDFKDVGKNNFYTIKLFTSNGKLVLTQEVTPYLNHKRINLSEINSGIYILKVIINNQSQTFKLIKE